MDAMEISSNRLEEAEPAVTAIYCGFFVYYTFRTTAFAVTGRAFSLRHLPEPEVWNKKSTRAVACVDFHPGYVRV